MSAARLAAIAARVASLALLLAPPARGAEQMPVVPEELAFTRSIDVQDEDEFQTSLFARHLHLPHERSTTVPAEVEYGVTDRLQAIIEIPYGIRDPADAPSVNGLEDLELGVRYALLDFRTPARARRRAHRRPSDWLPAEGARRRRRLPRADLHAQPMARVNGQLSFSWRRSWIGGMAAAEDDLEYDVALLYPWRQWFLIFEGAGETEAGETAYYGVPELVWKPRKGLELLVAVPVGFTHAAADLGVIASITVGIERLTGRGEGAD